jgi:antagonist of KipI
MDPYSMRLANVLAGNPQGEACLEFALAGAVFEVTATRLHFAFVGNFPVIINDEPFPANASYTLAKGERLEIGASDANTGTHGYLAVLGGFAAESQLGSVSTHLRSGIGGFGGGRGDGSRRGAAPTSSPEAWEPSRSRRGAAPTSSPVRPEVLVGAAPRRDPRIGTVLPTKLDEAPLAIERQLPHQLLPKPASTIRAVPGPQTEFFSKNAIERFFTTPWHITPASDRMGYRLGGGTVEVEDAGSMISEAVSPGSVQIPAGGEPIVLMADCGTVGGYPKIATVIGVDRDRLAQLRVGSEFRFEEVSVQDAQAALREQNWRIGKFEEDALGN